MQCGAEALKDKTGRCGARGVTTAGLAWPWDLPPGEGMRPTISASRHPCQAAPPPPPRAPPPVCLQGRDDIGRPLLERALRIQEAHLGPDHPDVLAIRDVLDEEA